MDRTKYIIVFKDVTVWNPESRELNNLYKAYLPAEHMMSAELMAKMVKGTVVGMLDNDGNVIPEYYIDRMEFSDDDGLIAIGIPVLVELQDSTLVDLNLVTGGVS